MLFQGDSGLISNYWNYSNDGLIPTRVKVISIPSSTSLQRGGTINGQGISDQGWSVGNTYELPQPVQSGDEVWIRATTTSTSYAQYRTVLELYYDGLFSLLR